MLRIAFAGLFVLLIACRQPEKQESETKSMYQEGFIEGSGIRLHYLDWGGTGQPLVLIHGFGDSPYLFEDLASALHANFRIIAYSKRGHGKSEVINSDYENSALVSDLKLLLDSLKIDRTNLLGWSMGGNDITEFAIRYPERTNKLIYVESGYDLSEEAFTNILKTIPQSPFPNAADLSSLDAYRKWYHKFWFSDIEWNPTLEAHLKATTQVSSDGSITIIPNDSISNLIMKAAMSYHRDYTTVQSPVLAIYAKPFFIPPVHEDSIVAAYENMETNIIQPWRLSNMNRMKSELKNVTIKEMPAGSHTSVIFLSKDSLVASVLAFLLDK
jgi:pimeloyl-ACP methyl ester carboxylesterase